MTGIPRRNQIDLNCKAEIDIANAIHEVEKLGADAKLTEAVMLLAQAKELVSDFEDAQYESQITVSI